MDYEKKYKKILSLAKSYKGNNLKEFFNLAFPEFTESKDERIRKALVKYFEFYRSNPDLTLDVNTWQGEKVSDILAYLEKQKEQKPTAEEVLIMAGLKPFKDGNQWCILAGDNIQEGICGFGETIDDALYDFLMVVLNMQKEQKPAEWSEENKEIMHDIIKYHYDQGEISSKHNKWASWLEHKYFSLQSHWKPSEEQMKALKVVARGFPTDDPDAIDSLLTDLQKLL